MGVRMFNYHKFISSVAWNLILITAGAIFYAIGLKAIAIPHGLLTGGISGLGLLLYYFTGVLQPGIWYFIINIPIFISGWFYISRRFFLYSIYGMIALSVAIDVVSFQINITDKFLAALAGGVIMGVGAGVTLHSLGSVGGNGIIAIILNQKLGIRIGTFFFVFNTILFLFSFSILETDLVLYSLVMNFIISYILDQVLSMFNQRKMVLIISNHHDKIASVVNTELNRGATLLDGTGTYTKRSKKVILTVVHSYQLKRLEEMVLSIDPDAFIITGNTYNVFGKGFSHPKTY